MLNNRNLLAFLTATVFHTLVLLAMRMIPIVTGQGLHDLAVDSIFTEEERPLEEITQVLEEDQTVSESASLISGGVVANVTGASSKPTLTARNIEVAPRLDAPDVSLAISERVLIGDDDLNRDLGEGEVTGEIGAVVDGYGAALKMMTEEIIRLMRQDKLLVVWLFDESESMKDDQAAIAENFQTVYEELRIVQKSDESFSRRKSQRDSDAILLTAIVSYGKSQHELLKPTSDLDKIREAIARIPVDETGEERMCTAVVTAIGQYRTLALGQKRKLVVIVVTDESGDDGKAVDDTVRVAKRARAPIYVMGREAIFGYPFAHVRWIDPIYKLTHWVRIRRGPETPFPECLQWDGLRARHDAFSSGFGPYELARMAKETGGVFYILPGEEERLTGAGAREERQYRFLDMREYQPLLQSRPEYALEVRNSEFRRTIWNVILELNPNEHDQLPKHDPQLNIREHWYPIEPPKFREEAGKEVAKAARAMTRLNAAIPLIEKIEPLRATEPSQRWRANYDLIRAQLYGYRVRLFQYLLAFDQHVNASPPRRPENKESNRWNVGRTREMIVPDETQFERIRQFFSIKAEREEYLSVLKQQEETARELFNRVLAEHPGTPWARRAQHELTQGFGMRFYEAHRSPHYDSKKIKVPNF